MTVNIDEICLYGQPISSGIAIGYPFISIIEEKVPYFRVPPERYMKKRSKDN